MKKSLITLVMLIVGLGAFSSSADTKTLTLKKSFSELEISAGVNIVYKPITSGTATVAITGDAKRIELIDVEIIGKTLNISPKPNTFGVRNGDRLKGVTITLTAPIINEIEASSGSSIRCNTAISAPNRKIDFEANSGASISFSSLNCKSIDIDASSGASISVKALHATKADIEVSSGASITVSNAVATEAECEASSGGSLRIAGNADKGSFSASSGGSIKASSFTVRNSHVNKQISGSISLKSN